jgi:hypothetical protein
VIIIVRGELPPKSSMEEDLQSYISMNTYLDSQDPWFWQKIRYARHCFGSGSSIIGSIHIRIRFRIRIQGFDDPKLKRIYSYKKIGYFWSKNCNLIIPRPP